MKILTLNAGSNSLKFEVVDATPRATGFGTSLLSGSYDDVGKPGSSFQLLQHKQPFLKREMAVQDHGHATRLLFEWLRKGDAREYGVPDLNSLARVAHRVVHGADLFNGPVRITPQIIGQIESLKDLAPLHNHSALQIIRAAEDFAGFEVPMFAAFDTVFHRNIPEEAALYALPPHVAERHKIRRYGFHGLSHRYLMQRYAELSGRAAEQLKLITLHLEGGSSVAAIRYGRSIDTSMGFTPLEGLMMGTRSGDLDPAIVTYLMRKEDLDAAGVEKFLNKECGLLGVSGVSADTRVLLQHRGQPRVQLALDLFCYRVKKYIGAYLAALGGADAIVFGGGIGENAAWARERICDTLGWCGAHLDLERNRAADDREAPISTDDSTLPIWVVPTEEGLMMASEIADVPL